MGRLLSDEGVRRALEEGAREHALANSFRLVAEAYLEALALA
jgi:hypothetical protein